MTTRTLAIGGGIAALACSTFASAGSIFAYSSFEEAFVGAQYVDTGDPLMDHALMNNDGQSWVNYGGGMELGFSSFYTNTRDSVGITDGDFVGATNFTGTVGAFTDGVQGFQISDPDGLMTTTMSSVDLTGRVAPSVSIDYYMQATGYEADDRVRIWVEVDGGVEIDLLNSDGADINDLGIEGAWTTLSLDLSGYTTATLNFELDSNSGSEALYVDFVRFSEIPAPGALALLGLAGLTARRRRG